MWGIYEFEVLITMQKFIRFAKDETVLSIAVILAVLSAIFVPVDSYYLQYVDFRTLALLFCLMTVIAGVRRRGVFSVIAGRLVAGSSGIAGTVTVLVLAAFFLSMLITNDVSLITLVPLTLNCFDQMPENSRKNWLIPAVVLETIAANLGSMATPIGNPQNLYLYGLSDLSFFEFLRIILPYSIVSLFLLMVWIRVHQARQKTADDAAGLPDPSADAADAVSPSVSAGSSASAGSGASAAAVGGASAGSSASVAAAGDTSAAAAGSASAGSSASAATGSETVTEPKIISAYLVLFLLCLTTVARIAPWPVPLGAVLLFVLLADRKTIREVDYSLLGTFLALFIFIGNLGRISSFRSALSGILTGHEVFTAIGASQVMSNVPAAILLSGFTDKIEALIIGTNLGGLGTMIASMASLISYKLITKGGNVSKGSYLLYFTAANCAFLVCLIALYLVIGG